MVRKGECKPEKHALHWWPRRVTPWLWGSHSRLSSRHHCLSGCPCHGHSQATFQGGGRGWAGGGGDQPGPEGGREGELLSRAGWLQGHPILCWLSPTCSFRSWISNKSHVKASFLSVASLCSSSSDWFALVSKCEGDSVPVSVLWLLPNLKEDSATFLIYSFNRFSACSLTS